MVYNYIKRYKISSSRADKLLYKIRKNNDEKALEIMKIIFKEEVRHT
jgi:hypothetical protein